MILTTTVVTFSNKYSHLPILTEGGLLAVVCGKSELIISPSRIMMSVVSLQNKGVELRPCFFIIFIANKKIR